MGTLKQQLRWVALSLGLALGYFVAARVGMLTSIGPSSVTAVWPPSGLALAALLLWGWRAVPGLALGAFWLNWQGFLVPMMGPVPAALGGALLLTVSSLSQAGLAAWWARTVPALLASEPTRQTLRFAACVALACVVAPSLGNGFLSWQGLLPSRELMYGWLVWWAGDCAGMLVVAPPLLLWRHPAIRRDPISSLAFPIVCMGLGLSLITGFIVGHLERQARVEQFRASSRGVAAALQQGIELAQRDLEVMRALYFKAEIDAPEFRTLSAPMRQRSPWESSFAWLPHIAQAPYGLFPVHWTDPPAESVRVTQDEAADPMLGPAVRRAHAQGVMAATPPLPGPAPGQVIVRLYVPVLADGVQGMGLHDASRVQGLVSVTLDLGRLLAGPGHTDELAQLDLHLYDPQATGLRGLAWDGQRAQPWSASLSNLARGVHEVMPLQIGDRRWALLSRPHGEAALGAPSWLPLGVFVGGLGFTALLSGFMVLRRRRDMDQQHTRSELEAQVAARTRDLVHTNAQLQQEVHERRALEDELRQAHAHADAANQAKSMFLANMSHEIRTPLNAVIGYAQLLREDPQLAAGPRARVGAIHAAGRRLLRLINDVLDLSKIESGKLQLHTERFEIWRELDEVVRLFAPRIEAKGLALQVHLDLPQPGWVQGDRNKIGQIVVNLLSNALKFTEQGQISLRAGRQGGQLWLEVQDSGPGLAPSELAQLFRPFQQGAAGQAKGGTGLGLVLSRHMAQAMGGELSLSSVPGQGTVARLALPLQLLDAPASPQISEDVACIEALDPATPCEVLVVEDDADSRAILVQALARLGCLVREASDGEAAWQLLLQHTPDMVFTDIRMPVLDGLALLRRLRADPARQALPVVAVSASSLQHERRHYVAEGFNDFVGKPFEFGEIYRMLAVHAHVRWRYRSQPQEGALAEPAHAPGERVLGDATCRALRALAEHALAGDVGAVREQLQGLPVQVLGTSAWRRLDAAARQYDFALLAGLATALAQGQPTGEAV